MMPIMFSKSHYDEVFGEVIFFDSSGKKHYVFISRVDGKTFLTAWWALIGAYYGLDDTSRKNFVL